MTWKNLFTLWCSSYLHGHSYIIFITLWYFLTSTSYILHWEVKSSPTKTKLWMLKLKKFTADEKRKLWHEIMPTRTQQHGHHATEPHSLATQNHAGHCHKDLRPHRHPMRGSLLIVDFRTSPGAWKIFYNCILKEKSTTTKYFFCANMKLSSGGIIVHERIMKTWLFATMFRSMTTFLQCHLYTRIQEVDTSLYWGILISWRGTGIMINTIFINYSLGRRIY